MKKKTIRRNETIVKEKKKQNEETFISYLLEKKKKEKEQKRALRLRRESEAFGADLSKTHRTIDQALEEAARDTDLAVAKDSKTILLGSSMAGADDMLSSSSSEEELNTEGLQAVKDIEKLTGGNLDIKPLDVDLNGMKPFLHTPKDGIIMPIETNQFYSYLKD